MTKLFAKLNKKVENFLSSSASEDTKKRVVANIKKANSKEYQMQVTEHQLVNHIIDDILDDPYWHQVAVEALEYRKSQGLSLEDW